MSRYFIYKKERCWACNGIGKIPEEKRGLAPIPPICHGCHGEGFIYVRVDLTKEILEEILELRYDR